MNAQPRPDEPTTTELHVLLARIQGGDNFAKEELLLRFARQLERLAHGMLRRFPNVARWEQTGDVLNSALLRLLHALRKIQPESTRRFYGLAAEMIRRELLDLARSYRNDRGASSAGDFAKLADPSDTDLDRWCAFHEGVASLPIEQREVVGLVFYHGWSQEQVAELFRVSVRTVGRWWQEALQTLRANGASC